MFKSRLRLAFYSKKIRKVRSFSVKIIKNLMLKQVDPDLEDGVPVACRQFRTSTCS